MTVVHILSILVTTFDLAAKKITLSNAFRMLHFFAGLSVYSLFSVAVLNTSCGKHAKRIVFQQHSQGDNRLFNFRNTKIMRKRNDTTHVQHGGLLI